MPDQVVNVHPSQCLTLPWDEHVTVHIDLEMIPLVRRLWLLGVRTEACCQDLGESLTTGGDLTGVASIGRQRHSAFYTGQAWLKMPLDDAKAFLGKLASHPEFRERQTRWTHPDAWMSFAYLLPDKTGSVVGSPWAQIHFPRGQIPAVIAALASMEGRNPGDCPPDSRNEELCLTARTPDTPSPGTPARRCSP